MNTATNVVKNKVNVVTVVVVLVVVALAHANERVVMLNRCVAVAPHVSDTDTTTEADIIQNSKSRIQNSELNI